MSLDKRQQVSCLLQTLYREPRASKAPSQVERYRARDLHSPLFSISHQVRLVVAFDHLQVFVDNFMPQHSCTASRARSAKLPLWKVSVHGSCGQPAWPNHLRCRMRSSSSTFRNLHFRQSSTRGTFSCFGSCSAYNRSARLREI